MAYGFQYVPHSCSKRGTCKICEKRIAKERDEKRQADQMAKQAIGKQ